MSWEFKDMLVFDSIEEMKTHVVKEQNRLKQYIGRTSAKYSNSDVALLKHHDYDPITGWKNCYDISIGGEIIGHCGE